MLFLPRSVSLRSSFRPSVGSDGRLLTFQRLGIVTLAIETSCDDTAVAILETGFESWERALQHRDEPDGHVGQGPKHEKSGNRRSLPKAKLWFNDRITADNAQYGGIHPLQALISHQRNLATLVKRATESFRQAQAKECTPQNQCQLPDLVAVTRGPGMRSNLATGIDFAKGLSVAWNVPLVGVHHMQAHLLTPGLLRAIGASEEEPAFPFLSLLVSGGHTMLLLSKSLTDHELLADTDLPLGQALDKIARLVVPQSVLAAAESSMYGAVLEKFVFPEPSDGHSYRPPQDRSRAYYKLKRTADHAWPWSIRTPFAEADGGAKRDSMEYSFSGVTSAVERIMKYDQLPESAPRTPRTGDVSLEERKVLAKEAMRACFEHLTSRVLLALDACEEPIKTVVVSGGVASNQYLRNILMCWLSSFGYAHVEINCPPPAYCTDNAAMIAWAGTKMYDAGWRSDLGIIARRKWPLGSRSATEYGDGAGGQGEDNATGVLDVDGWYNVNQGEPTDAKMDMGNSSSGPRPWAGPGG